MWLRPPMFGDNANWKQFRNGVERRQEMMQYCEMKNLWKIRSWKDYEKLKIAAMLHETQIITQWQWRSEMMTMTMTVG